MVPPVTGTWYQRTAAWVASTPATVLESHSDSTPPRFEYWFWTIERSPNVSRSLPSFAGTVPGPEDQVVAVIESVGPVKVEFAGAVQSAWNFQTRTRSAQHHVGANRFGRPAGGVPVCARALLGRRVNTEHSVRPWPV